MPPKSAKKSRLDLASQKIKERKFNEARQIYQEFQNDVDAYLGLCNLYLLEKQQEYLVQVRNYLLKIIVINPKYSEKKKNEFLSLKRSMQLAPLRNRPPDWSERSRECTQLCDILIQEHRDYTYIKNLIYCRYLEINTTELVGLLNFLEENYAKDSDEKSRELTKLYKSILLDLPNEKLTVELLQRCLPWFESHAVLENAALIERLLNIGNSCSNQNESSLKMICEIARYFLRVNYKDKAKRLFDRCFKEQSNITQLKEYHDDYHELLSSKEKEEFTENNPGSGSATERAFRQAKRIINSKRLDSEKLREQLEVVRDAALERCKEAMSFLSELEACKNDTGTEEEKFYNTRKKLYAIQFKHKIFVEKGGYKPNAKPTSDSYFYSPKEYPNRLLSQIRSLYDDFLERGDIVACYEAGLIRCSGQGIFPRNLYLSRQLFEKAANGGHFGALLELSKLCFYGEGGPVELEKAQEHLKSYLEKYPDNPEANYLLGEIYYFHFLYFEGHSPDQAEENLAKSQRYFEVASEQDHEKARISLEILNERVQTNHMEVDDVKGKIQSSRDQEENSNGASGSGSAVVNREVTKLSSTDIKELYEIAQQPGPLAEPSKEKLLEYYQKQENGILKLISTVCYEAQRYPEDHPVCKVLKELIHKLDSNFALNTPMNTFQQHLETQETELEDYFVECPSDDSDDEREEQYKESDRRTTRTPEEAQILINKLKKTTLDALRKIQSLPDGEQDASEEKYKEELEKISSLYSDIDYRYKPPHKLGSTKSQGYKKEDIERDLEILNYYTAQGCPEEAMQLLSIPFCVVQLRGLHFNTEDWNQPTRRKIRSLVRNSDHPFRDQPIFCRAAYEHAGVTDFFDFSEKTRLKLEKSARLVQLKLQKYFESNPPKSLPDRPKELASAERILSNASTTSDGLQQLYSSNYDAAHQYFEYMSHRPERFFVNGRNPFISTGDLPSVHPARYAYGNKFYTGYEYKRLRPQYGKKLKSHRPYSGAIYLTVHPVYDFFHRSQHHVISKNMHGSLVMDDRIHPERETNFLFSIKSGRLRFIDLTKFPSFEKAESKKFFLLKYGLDLELYQAFRKSLLTSKPHLNKRRLTTHLLGEYFSAYTTLSLMQQAYEEATELEYVLLFRTALGVFSLKPCYNISPNPNGDDESKRLRRYKTQELRKKLKRNSDQISDDPAEIQPSKADDKAPPEKRARVDSDVDMEEEELSAASSGNPSDIGLFASDEPVAISGETSGTSALPQLGGSGDD